MYDKEKMDLGQVFWIYFFQNTPCIQKAVITLKYFIQNHNTKIVTLPISELSN